jgi:hypothetical protein
MLFCNENNEAFFSFPLWKSKHLVWLIFSGIFFLFFYFWRIREICKLNGILFFLYVAIYFLHFNISTRTFRAFLSARLCDSPDCVFGVFVWFQNFMSMKFMIFLCKIFFFNPNSQTLSQKSSSWSWVNQNSPQAK